ncbi:hypothetical protein BMS3Bbin02_01750 [bacterium BMS3Bbin02]|nr:hypothetical protein BMS3Bbin02_01750 [bacterium BMS3Bbin02]
MGFQTRNAIDDMDAGGFQQFRPTDVRCLVESGLEFDKDDDLFACLGSRDE